MVLYNLLRQWPIHELMHFPAPPGVLVSNHQHKHCAAVIDSTIRGGIAKIILLLAVTAVLCCLPSYRQRQPQAQQRERLPLFPGKAELHGGHEHPYEQDVQPGSLTIQRASDPSRLRMAEQTSISTLSMPASASASNSPGYSQPCSSPRSPVPELVTLP